MHAFLINYKEITYVRDALMVSQLALLCGAPGLGKTTLAHIIAKHAGYHVVEMNARLDYCCF